MSKKTINDDNDPLSTAMDWELPMFLWDSLSRTDPKFTKSFSRGGWSGTDINPQYRWKRLTELLGPVGRGWGILDHNYKIENLPDGQVMCIVQVTGYWKDPVDQIVRQTPPGFGQEFLFRETKGGQWRADDEALKKAFTDALGNAFKYLGLGSDVYMGMYDDSKYLNSLEKVFRETEPEPKKHSSPARGAGQAVSDKTDNGQAEPSASGGSRQKAGATPASQDVVADREDSEVLHEDEQNSDGGIGTNHSLGKNEGITIEAFMMMLDLETKDGPVLSDLKDMLRFLDRNHDLLDSITEMSGAEVEACMGALNEWVKERELADIKSLNKLKETWAKNSRAVNGLKRTQPKIYQAIADAFKEKQASMKGK